MAGARVGSSAVEDQVELAKALGVGDQVDCGDLPARDREAEYDARLSPWSPHGSRRQRHRPHSVTLMAREAPVIKTDEEYSLHPIGRIRSTLRAVDQAPRQGSEGAPDAWLEVNPTFAGALLGIAAGDEVIVITWLHRADRDVLEVHPRGDPEVPLAGVFATRSPHRPNPLGLHRVTVREISGTRLRIGPIEALDGTPVADVKPVLVDCADA
jgi:tRNA-Thr(GGU) m(6)t(6)A37 methyltransferase TsaA